MEEILTWARVIASLAFLAYASWSDFKTREVSNSVWVAFAPIALLLTFAQFLFFPPYGDVLQSMLYYVISFGIVFVFSVALFYAGAFGGADAKALMCIALALPEPRSLEPLFSVAFPFWRTAVPLSGFTSPIFPITVFSNSVIIAALSVFYALVRNLVWRLRNEQSLFGDYKGTSFGRKLLALLCGYRVTIEYLRRSFLYPLEDFETRSSGETERRLLLFPKDAEREEIVARLVSAKETGRLQGTVWATPGLPMLIFITLGLTLALTVGDIVWLVLHFALT
jgi:preflagellin peptidase FlaK